MRFSVEQCSGRQWSRIGRRDRRPTLDQYEASRHVHPLFTQGPPAPPSNGGLRPQTAIELARDQHYKALPTTDAGELAEWFHRGAQRGSLPVYLKGSRTRVV